MSHAGELGPDRDPYLSPIPAATVGEIRSLLYKFLWGAEIRKYHGLSGIRSVETKRKGIWEQKNLGWFNVALLGKWVWRFLHENDRLWAKVIRWRHGPLGLDWDGHSGGCGLVEGKFGRVWDTRFWKDKWRGEQAFKDRYRRLYQGSECGGCGISNGGQGLVIGRN